MIRVLTYDGHMTGAADKAAVDAEKAAAAPLLMSPMCWTAASMPA